MDCPEENLLLELASGRLDEQRSTSLHEHLDGCMSCMHVIAELLRSEGPAASDYPARYRVIEESGRGGQARVLRGYDSLTARDVAIKELLPVDASPARLERLRTRFIHEARLTARLTHPGIVPVFDIGFHDDGQPFYTMQFLRGRTLAQELQGKRSLSERLPYLSHFLDLCQAVSFAHDQGIVHRDIKPQNVVIGEFGQTMLVDWGLAKLMAGARDPAPEPTAAPPSTVDATAIGSVIGTPAYMSPEQASGRLEDVDERSDVFGLGAVLYQVLTGKAPLAGRQVTELLEAARSASIAPVSELTPGAPAELAVIAHKALALDRASRYERAADLAADVQAYLTGGRVGAYEYSSWELLRRLVGRHRRVVAATAVGLAALLAALVALSVALRSADREKRHAEVNGAAALVEGAQAALAATDLVEARAKLRVALETTDSLEARSTWRQLAATPLRWRHVIGGELNTLDASPTERLLAVAGQEPGIRLIDADTIAVRVLLAGDAQVTSVRFAPDGKTLAAGDDAGRLWLWDLAAGRARDLGAASSGLNAVRWDPTCRILYALTEDGRLWRFDVAGQAPRLIPFPTTLGIGLAVTGDGGELAVVTAAGEPHLLDVATGKATPLGCPPRISMSLTASPDGRWLGGVGAGGVICLWAQGAQAAAAPPVLLPGTVSAGLGFSPDSRLLAVAGQDGRLRVWDHEARSLRGVFAEGDNIFARQPTWLVDGRSVALIFLDGTVKLFDVDRPPGEPATPEPRARLSAEVSPDGTRLVTGSQDGRLRVHDLVSGAEVLAIRAHAGAAFSAAYSPDGSWLASAGADSMVRLWDARDGGPIRTLAGHVGVVTRVRWSASGRALVSSGTDGIRVWDGATGVERAAFPTPDLWTLPEVQGEELVLGNRDGTLVRHDLTTGREVGRIRVVDDVIQGVANLDGDRALAVLTIGGGLFTVDRATGAAVKLDEVDCRHERCTLAAARGQIAVGLPGGELLSWDSEGRRRRPILGARLDAIVFTGGARLAGCDGRGTVTLFDLAAGRPAWRGPLLRAGEAVTHEGWIDLAGAPVAVAGSAWRSAAAAARLAAEAGDVLCVATDDGAVEVWDEARDVRTARVALAADRVEATTRGCAVLAGGAAMVVAPGGETRVVAARAGAIAIAGDEVVTGDEAAVGRTMLGEPIDGYAHGGLVIRRAAGPPLVLRDTPHAPVVRIVASAPNLVAAAYASGALGVWSATTGERLLSVWLHGPATGLQLRGHRLVALTAVGRIGVWDLETFAKPHCELLREVWRDVPVVWDGGHLVLRAPSRDHRCSPPR